MPRIVNLPGAGAGWAFCEAAGVVMRLWVMYQIIAYGVMPGMIVSKVRRAMIASGVDLGMTRSKVAVGMIAYGATGVMIDSGEVPIMTRSMVAVGMIAWSGAVGMIA